MSVSKPKDSSDQPQPPRSDDEVKRLRDAVLFARERLHSVVKKNGGSVAPLILEQAVNQAMAKSQENQAAPPRQQHRPMQPQTHNQKGPSKNEPTKPSSLNDRTSTVKTQRLAFEVVDNFNSKY